MCWSCCGWRCCRICQTGALGTTKNPWVGSSTKLRIILFHCYITWMCSEQKGEELDEMQTNSFVQLFFPFWMVFYGFLWFYTQHNCHVPFTKWSWDVLHKLHMWKNHLGQPSEYRSLLGTSVYPDSVFPCLCTFSIILKRMLAGFCQQNFEKCFSSIFKLIQILHNSFKFIFTKLLQRYMCVLVGLSKPNSSGTFTSIHHLVLWQFPVSFNFFSSTWR